MFSVMSVYIGVPVWDPQTCSNLFKLDLKLVQLGARLNANTHNLNIEPTPAVNKYPPRRWLILIEAASHMTTR